MKKISLMIFLVCLLALAAGCSPSQSPTSGGRLQAWIDAPLNGSVLPLEPYEIVAHASDPQAVSNLEIQVNDDQLASLPHPDPGELLALFRQVWVPPGPGEYEIQVKAQNAAGEWSAAAVVQVFVENQAAAASVNEPADSETPEPELTSCLPSLTANENATCRTGPSSYHKPVGYLLAGQQAPITGRNQDWTWWASQLSDLDTDCWIADSTVASECLPNDLAFVESPPYIIRIGKSAQEFYWGDNPLQRITIQAQAGGESPLSSLRVVYHIQGRDNWTSTVMVNTTSELWEGDLYARSLKGYEKFDSARVEYYLEAVSQNGLTTQSEILANVVLKKVP